MYKILRISFTIVAAIAVAAALPLGIFFGWVGALGAAGAALAAFLLVLLFKSLQEGQEQKDNPPPPQGDFFAPLPKNDQTDESGKN